MAYLYRVTVGLLLCFCSVAYASFPASVTPVVTQYAWNDYPSDWYASSELAAYSAIAKSPGWVGCVVTNFGPTGARIDCQNGGHSLSWMTRASGGVKFCPLYATLSGSVCNCSLPALEVNGACVVPESPNQAKCTAFAGSSDYSTTFGRAMPGTTTCASNGCAAVWSPTVIIVKSKVTGKTETQGDIVFNGSVCAYDDAAGGVTVPALGGLPATAQAGSSSCVGGTTGTVNGVSVCIALDPNANTIESIKTSSTATGPAAGASAPAGGASAPVTSSTTSSTTCTGGNCSTTSTTTTPGAGGGPPVSTTTTVDQPKEDFCTQNPRAPACVTSTFSGGACNSPPVCGGDAVQCATASFTWKTACALQPPESSPESDLYNLEKAKGQGDQTSGITSNVTIGPGSFDQTNVLGAAGGVADLVVPLPFGPSITLPLSNLNVWLVRLGYVFQAVTFLLCARIVARG